MIKKLEKYFLFKINLLLSLILNYKYIFLHLRHYHHTTRRGPLPGQFRGRLRSLGLCCCSPPSLALWNCPALQFCTNTLNCISVMFWVSLILRRISPMPEAATVARNCRACGPEPGGPRSPRASKTAVPEDTLLKLFTLPNSAALLECSNATETSMGRACWPPIRSRTTAP